jgi:Membrane bound FAD containing D-sorbitol dehydrogenase
VNRLFPPAAFELPARGCVPAATLAHSNAANGMNGLLAGAPFDSHFDAADHLRATYARGVQLMLDDFLALSYILTDETSLNPQLAHEYLRRAVEQDALGIEAVLNRFREIRDSAGDMQQGVRDRLISDAALGPVAQRILLLWYTSGWLDADNKTLMLGTSDQYFSSLLWPAIRAHVPGLSGGYFGHWSYPPEN